MTNAQKPSKILYSKVVPLQVPDNEVRDLNIQHRCPVELFRAKRGFEQCKLNFLTSMVESYDEDFTHRESIRESPTKNNVTNNNDIQRDSGSDEDIDSERMTQSGFGISMVTRKERSKRSERLRSESRINIIEEATFRGLQRCLKAVSSSNSKRYCILPCISAFIFEFEGLK